MINDSYDVKTTYSHDCWGGSTSEEVYTLNYDKLSKNLLTECFGVINEQIAISSPEQNQALYELKYRLTKHFEVIF